MDSGSSRSRPTSVRNQTFSIGSRRSVVNIEPSPPPQPVVQNNNKQATSNTGEQVSIPKVNHSQPISLPGPPSSPAPATPTFVPAKKNTWAREPTINKQSEAIQEKPQKWLSRPPSMKFDKLSLQDISQQPSGPSPSPPPTMTDPSPRPLSKRLSLSSQRVAQLLSSQENTQNTISPPPTLPTPSLAPALPSSFQSSPSPSPSPSFQSQPPSEDPNSNPRSRRLSISTQRLSIPSPEPANSSQSQFVLPQPLSVPPLPQH